MAGRFDRRRPGWSQDTARPLADNVGTTSNPQSPVFVPEAHSKAGSGLGGGDHPEAAPEAVSGPVRAVPGHGGWAGRVDMRFEPDHSGWRIVGPPELPAVLAEAGWLEWNEGRGEWLSSLFRVPASGRKQRMREHVERCLIGARKRIRAAERAEQKGTEQ